jgi:hypothetical protein
MTASFDSAAFGELASSGTFAVWSKAGTTQIKHIPGGDKNVIQKISVGLPRLALPIKATASQLTALYAKRGVTGTLVFGYESATAVLESITNVAEQAAGKNVYTATLNLIRTASVSSAPSTALITEASEYFITEAGEYFIQE